VPPCPHTSRTYVFQSVHYLIESDFLVKPAYTEIALFKAQN